MIGLGLGRARGRRAPALPPARIVGHAVPMYVHPVLAPQLWQLLTGRDLGVGFVVVNAATGPGDRPEPAYEDELARLVAAGAPAVGYVDCAYGRRDPRAVVDDVRRWRTWYGVTGTFLDRIPPQDDGWAARLADAVRAAGATRVVLNPGVVPEPGVCRAGDVVVTFEGTDADHRVHAPAARLRDVAPERLCHLVHTVPDDVTWSSVAGRAAAAGVGIVGVSHGSMPNPWTGPPPGMP